MRLPEQRLNDWIAKWLAGRALVERVENRVKRDTPDIFVATSEWAGWIESKTTICRPTTVCLPSPCAEGTTCRVTL